MLQRSVIYDAPQERFFHDVLTKRIADIMKDNFKGATGANVGDAEYNSWDRSTGEVKGIVELSGLSGLYVSFEYRIPYNDKRIDCLLFGKNASGKGFVVHIELKQWQKVDATEIEGNFVETYTGGSTRRVPHPSQQVEGYHNYLIGFVEVFEEREIDLFGCSYCHNYRKHIGEGLFDSRYSEVLKKFPIYSRDDVTELATKLKTMLSKGEGFEVFNRFMKSPIKPSKKLLDNVSKIVENNSDFTLLNDQIIARNSILAKIRLAERHNHKSVILVKGGPGTGKTIIALHILAEIAASKRKKSVFFSSKSKPLIEAVKYYIGGNAKVLFTNLSPFVPSKIGENELDVLIVDEAHRIGKSSNMQFTPKEHRTDMPQIDQLVRCSKTSVFFIDDKQAIRCLEVGSSDLIKEAARKHGCSIVEEELTSQFRCNGSDNYLDWLESILGYSTEKRILKKQDNFDFRIFDDPKELYETISQKNQAKGNTARIVAGYCWPWSKGLDSNGDLVKDVKIGDFEMPWETHEDVPNPPKKYVRWYEWAYKPEGIQQVGCIYTAQGFEFDYIGVIIGPDLKYDQQTDSLVGDIKQSCDPVLKRSGGKSNTYVQNIYRVLLSRGLKGCYVYFTDDDTKNFFKSRIDQSHEN